MCSVGLMEIFILSQLYVSISTSPWQLRIFSYLSKFSCFLAPGPGLKNITKLMWICVIVGVMGCRNNGLSEKWAVGVMGCRNNDLTPIILSKVHGIPIFWTPSYSRRDTTRSACSISIDTSPPYSTKDNYNAQGFHHVISIIETILLCMEERTSGNGSNEWENFCV